jgi:hypothetical protein
MGFDLTLYSETSAEEWDDHQNAVQEYEEAYEEWQESDDDDEPELEDFAGYDYQYDGEGNPREGVEGWAAVTFKANGSSVEILDVEIDSEDSFYSDGLNYVKRQHSGIIDLRLD